jgi:hypothetical protein
MMLFSAVMFLLMGADGTQDPGFTRGGAGSLRMRDAGPEGILETDGTPWVKPMAWEEIESWGSALRGGARMIEGPVEADKLSSEGLEQEHKENPPSKDWNFDFSLHGQWSLPFGHAYGRTIDYRGVTYVTRSVKWSDIYEPGWGVDVEGDMYFAPKDGGVNLGLGVVVSTDVYGRGRISDAFSGDLVSSNLTMNCLLFGLTVAGGDGPGLFGKGFFGVGPVHYSAVSTTISGSGIAQFEAGFARNTVTIASDFRGDLGYRFGQHVSLVLGAGIRIQAPPNVDSAFEVNSRAFYTFDISFGFELAF